LFRIASLASFQAPDEAKNIGDEITYSIPADKDHGMPAAKADFKVLALEKVKDWDTVKLSYSVAETEGDPKASSSGTLWISAADGSLVKSESTVTNVKPYGAPFPLTGKYNIERTK
jgi:hypothetical protein